MRSSTAVGSLFNEAVKQSLEASSRLNRDWDRLSNSLNARNQRNANMAKRATAKAFERSALRGVVELALKVGGEEKWVRLPSALWVKGDKGVEKFLTTLDDGITLNARVTLHDNTEVAEEAEYSV